MLRCRNTLEGTDGQVSLQPLVTRSVTLLQSNKNCEAVADYAPAYRVPQAWHNVVGAVQASQWFALFAQIANFASVMGECAVERSDAAFGNLQGFPRAAA